MWGGEDWNAGTNWQDLSSGGVYDSATDTWTATSTNGVPTMDASWTGAHSAAWTGTEMLIFGGTVEANLYRYDPAANSGAGQWTASAATQNIPVDTGNYTMKMASHAWIGSKFLVWGGSYTNVGGLYDPVADSWISTAATNAPGARTYTSQSGVWTGTQFIVWGGYSSSFACLNTGGVFTP